MTNRVSRRKFLSAIGAAVALPRAFSLSGGVPSSAERKAETMSAKTADRIVDTHVHFDEKNPNFLSDLLKLSDRLNLTACVLTPFAHRKAVVEAGKQHPSQIVPLGSVDLDAPDVVKQGEEVHAIRYPGLGELEFVRKPYNDSSYFPVYELANRYGWIVLFHTGIVLRRKFDEPEDVASGRMGPLYLEEIARRFPKITVLGAHCGNPEYEWAAEIDRWNWNVFFCFRGSSLTKMHARLTEFQRFFWWSSTEWHSAEWKVKTPNDDPNAFIKIVFGSDVSLNEIDSVVNQYRRMFDACNVPART